MAFVRSTSQARLEDGLRCEQIWTENGWQKIVVYIIADGRTKCQTPEELHAEKLSKLQPPFFESAELSVSYNDCVAGLAIRPPDNEASQDETTKREDYYKNFRTWLVLLWVISNGVLVSVVSSARVSQALTGSGDPNATNPYMAFLMYAVALLAINRFAGALVYLMKRSHRGY